MGAFDWGSNDAKAGDVARQRNAEQMQRSQDQAANVQSHSQQYNAQYNQDREDAKSSISQAAAARYQANAARGQQQDALALQQAAANGTAPSRAQIMGQQMTDQSLQAQMAGAASARGGSMAQMAAMRNAQQGAAQYQQQATQQQMAMRAGEMADARNAYMAGASGIRSGDLATSQAALAAANQQAAMGAQAGQMGAQNDQLGYNYNALAQQAQQFGQSQEQDYTKMAEGQSNKDTEQTINLASKAVSTIGSIAGALSDERAKSSVQDVGYMPLYAPEGETLMQTPEGHGYTEKLGASLSNGKEGLASASLAGPSAQRIETKAKPAPKQEERKMTDEEMMAWADREMAGANARTANVKSGAEQSLVLDKLAAEKAGESPVASANRAMAPITYEYKPGMQPPNQAPGEGNLGVSAQNMSQDPLAAAALRRDPQTGMMMVDTQKLTHQNSAGIGYLQQKQDATDQKLAELSAQWEAQKKAGLPDYLKGRG